MSIINMGMAFSDAMTKCKLVAAGMSAASDFKENSLFVRFALGWFSSQFSKYVYERFLIAAPHTNSLFKNIAVVLVIMAYSLDIHIKYSIDQSQLLGACTFMIFVGAIMDSNMNSRSAKKFPKLIANQGRKLRKPNEKA